MTSALKFTALAGLVAGVLFGTGALEAQAARRQGRAAVRPNRAAQVSQPVRRTQRPVVVAPQPQRHRGRRQPVWRPVRRQPVWRPVRRQPVRRPVRRQPVWRPVRPQVIFRPQWQPVMVPAPRYNQMVAATRRPVKLPGPRE